MDELNIFVRLTAVILFVLLYKFNKRFGKVEKELNEIKKGMDHLLQIQGSKIPEEVKPEEDLAVVPPMIEGIPICEKPLKEEAFKEEIQSVIAEDRTDEALHDVPCQASIIPEKLVTAEKPVTPKKKKNINYEKFIGENLFGKIGILIFVIGVGLFVKFAIDKDWINETMRTVLGFLTGSALLAVAERLQKKYRTFSSLLAGGAFAVFYITVAIAFHYYHLFSQTVAFIILVGITVVMTFLSVLYDRRELAITSLIGGFIAPFLVSSGEGNYLVLFTYLTILNLGMFGLSLYKKWGELPVISFVFTYLMMVVFVLTSYSGRVDIETVACHLFMFATLFYFIFLLPVLSVLKTEGKKMSRVLLYVIAVNNFIYLFFGMMFLRDMNLPFKSSGLLSLFIAIVNLVLVIWLRKSKQDYKFLIYTMLGLVLTFVSVTVPIQLEGNFITLFWASEMVLLLWLYVKSKIRVYEYATVVLVVLTIISYLMDVYASGGPTETIFLNGAFATSLFVGLAMGAFALLMERNRSFFSTARILNYIPWNAIMLLGSVVVLYYTFFTEFSLYFEEATRKGALMLLTSVSIFTVCYAFAKRFPIIRYAVPYIVALGANVLVYIVNIWTDYGANLTIWPILLRWLSVVFIIANMCNVAKRYYASVGWKPLFTVYLSVLSTLLWLLMVRSFLWQVGVEDFSAGFSLSLISAGLVQMVLGMRLHQKVLRMVSLSTFGIVLVKLAFMDLWAMSPIGKIIVFIILGLILLVLSFLYQKLKDVLFRNDEDETE